MCVTLLGSVHVVSQTAFLLGSAAKLVDLVGRLRTVRQNSFVLELSVTRTRRHQPEIPSLVGVSG